LLIVIIDSINDIDDDGGGIGDDVGDW